MDIGTKGWLDKVRPQILPKQVGKVLEIGSVNINGTVRDYFKAEDYESYVGVDMMDGKDVDIVMNGHDVKDHFEKESFDLVICMNTLEHDNKFWLTLESINYVLKKGGYFLYCQPTYNFPIHRHPKDYWRVLPDGLQEVIFEGYELLDWEEVFSKIIDGKGVNPILCGVGRKL